MTAKQRLFTYLKPLRSALIIAVIFALLFVIAQISQPFLLGKALDASKDNNQGLFNIYVFIALGLAILGVISAYIFEVIVMNSSQKAIKKARDEIYQKINSIALKDFDNKYRGDLLLLEIRDMENYAAGLYAVFKTLIQGIFTVIITIIMMLMVNWILALGVIVLSPLSMLMARFVSRFSSKHYKKQNELQARISSVSLETLNNIDIVQSLNYEESSLEAFNKDNEVLKKEGVVASFSASWVNPSTRFVRHFRIYFRNNHPAYIVDEEGNKYVFHRVTHSKTSGGKKNWKKENPLVMGGDEPTYIVKKEERDKKTRFSPFKLDVKPNFDISYPDIKKAGNLQTIVALDYESSKDIKTNGDKESKKKAGRSQTNVVNNNCPGTNIKPNKHKKLKKKK